jgi:hypothetical protein
VLASGLLNKQKARDRVAQAEPDHQLTASMVSQALPDFICAVM